jgi:hypothetical protein
VRVRRAQHLEVQHALHRDVERVARGTAHHLRAGRGGQAAAERGTSFGLLDIGLALERVLDRAVAGAAADIAFQRAA